ncbi:hypothetical protein [Leptospira yasudae]|uniref:Uncharacterized protein n=1 Tax=Leptospira yasudae TaxID=2202201 RepID=A0A7I0IRH4_9LEPT|nr:hypothetical protein [Leptospira yasudae]TGL83074.1 hypothetical protein EHQ77_02130 [Leptospira yasudae]TGL85695.1 hypothetical protein EHQ83_07555 [Leptospira yasudae]
MELKENWTKIFPYAYPQKDDLTPVPIKPFDPNGRSGYYNVVDTFQFAAMFGIDPGEQNSFSCLVLDIDAGQGAIKFLFDKRIYLFDISKISQNHYRILTNLQIREIVFLPDPNSHSSRSIYRLDFYDGVSGCGKECKFDNYAASNSSLFVSSLDECIEMNLESTIHMMNSLKKE